MAISRRHILLGGVAIAALPIGRHIYWGEQDYERDGFDPAHPKSRDGEKPWMNWSGLRKATPKQLATPKSVLEVAEILKTSPTPIRPVGSGHSFTALVPSEGTIVDISAMSGLQKHDSEAQTASLGAGTRLQHGARLLSEKGLGFANLPDIDVQTLAGGYATATHGTGRDLTAIHDYVRGFELVTPAGDVIEVTADKEPELFQAGKVSLGSLGIITRYDLKVEKAFNLRRRAWLEKIDSLLGRFDELSKTHRNFELLYFPSTGYAAGFSHDLFEGEVSGREKSEDDDFMGGLRTLRDQLGWWPWLREKIAQSEIEEGPVEDMTDEAWKLLATSRPIKFNEMEYHIPLENGLDTLRTAIEMMDARKTAYFPIEARVTAPDDAWLSPFNGGRRLSIAIHSPADESFEYFFEDFEPMFRKAGGRPHWGKLHSLGAKELRELYPDFDRFNALRKSLDPDGKMLNAHLAKLFGEEQNG